MYPFAETTGKYATPYRRAVREAGPYNEVHTSRAIDNRPYECGRKLLRKRRA